eukprot:411152-Prymnesium_polylepis.1
MYALCAAAEERSSDASSSAMCVAEWSGVGAGQWRWHVCGSRPRRSCVCHERQKGGTRTEILGEVAQPVRDARQVVLRRDRPLDEALCVLQQQLRDTAHREEGRADLGRPLRLQAVAHVALGGQHGRALLVAAATE